MKRKIMRKIYATKFLLILLELQQVKCISEEFLNENHKTEDFGISNKGYYNKDGLFKEDDMLLNAVREKDVNEIFCLLTKGAYVNALDELGNTPLHLAAGNSKSEDIVKVLLMFGADVEARNGRYRTPIHIATIYDQMEVLKLLLPCQPNVDARDMYEKTALSYALSKGNSDILITLLENSGDPNISYRYGRRARHFATHNENIDTSEVVGKSANINSENPGDIRTLHDAGMNKRWILSLLENCANTSLTNEYGWTPLHYAAYLRRPSAMCRVSLLLEHGAPIEAKIPSGCTALHLAAQYGEPSTILLLLQSEAEMESTDENGFTPLLHAVQREDKVEEVVKLLLEKGADVNVIDRSSRTPLHYAANSSNADLVRLILDFGANVDASDRHGITPLHLASVAGEPEVIRVLLSFEAIVNSSDSNGSTPLHNAIRSRNHKTISSKNTTKIEKIVELLLSKGADVNTSDNSGSTPLHLAAEIGDLAITKHLLNNNANVEAKNNEGLTPIVVAESLENIDVLRELLKRGAYFVPKEKYANSLLRKAIQAGYADVVQYLLKNNVDVNFIYQDGLTPLHYAAQYGKGDVMTLLLGAGAKVDAVDGAGSSPLHVAASNGDLTSVKVLLDFNATINAVDRNNSTALHLASKLGHYIMVNVLLRRGANPNVTNKDQRTPVQEAVLSNQLEVLKIYINHDISISFTTYEIRNLLKTAICYNKPDMVEALYNISIEKNAPFWEGSSSVLIAVGCKNITALEFLLKKGAKVNAFSNRNHPLHAATATNQTAAIEILLQYGSDVNTVNIDGEAPLHIAVERSIIQAVPLLLKYNADVNIEPNLNRIWEFEMKISTNIKSYMELLKHLYRDNMKINSEEKALSPIAFAVWRTNKDILQLMIDARGKTALNPKEAEWPPLHVACFLGQTDMIKFLVHAGADVNLMDRLGMTCLHKAVMAQDVNIVRSIIELKADVNAEGFLGLTPLHIAIKFHKEATLKLLIANDADVDKEDSAGFNTLLYAEIGGHPLFEKLLVEKSFNLNSTNRYNYLINVSAIIEVNVLLKYLMFHVNNWEYYKEDYFNRVVVDASYNQEYLEFLFRLKERYRLLTVDLKDFKNVTLSKLELIRKRHHSLLRLVLNMTKDPDKQDKILGWTALHWAAATGDLGSVQLLVDGGARLSLKSMLSQTPMYLARYWGHIDICRYLKSKGAVW